MNVILIILYVISVIGALACTLFDMHHKRELTLGGALLYLIIVLTPIINSVMFIAVLSLLSSDIVIWERKVK